MTMLGLFGLGPADCVVLLFLVLTVVLVVVLTRRAGRTAPPRRRGPDDPLGRIKHEYETLTERERRELLDFIQDDLRRLGLPDSGKVPPPVPPEGYTP
jgi:hypothetical protein